VAGAPVQCRDRVGESVAHARFSLDPPFLGQVGEVKISGVELSISWLVVRLTA
jgi:hypothetical protein